MTQRVLLVPAIALFFFASAAPADEDQKEAHAVIERAAKAHGGADNLTKLRAVRRTMRGKSFVNGVAVPVELVRLDQLPNQYKTEARLEIAGEAVLFISVLNGDKMWTSYNGETAEADENTLQGKREELRAQHLESLLPLMNDKTIRLSFLGEIKVAERPALGVKALTKGQRDVDLYFDKENALLVKTARLGVNQNGKEVLWEHFYNEYKDVGGLKRPMKVFVQQDGERTSEWEVLEMTFVDKIEDREFGKP